MRILGNTMLKRFMCSVVGSVAGVVVGLAILIHVFPFAKNSLAEAQNTGATQILDSEGGLISWRVDECDMWRVPVKIDQVSPWVIKSIVAAEDKRFWSHFGVDLKSVIRAVTQNVVCRQRISGASTISMQTIRLLNPRRRTWLAKVSESIQAIQMEGVVEKGRVLEAYLNTAPYGGNVIGIEAAARKYFGKSALNLTLGEAALLSGIPQRPAHFNPKKHLAAALRRREYVLKRMLKLKMISCDELQAAIRQPISIASTPVKVSAPRFADFIVMRNRKSGGVLQTTINPNVQNIAKGVSLANGRKLRKAGIDGLAVVIVDTEKSSLAAMVGNAFANDAEFRWVNAATARRQPGSLLKPYIFCTAYEKGLLTTKTLVYDVPMQWAEYSPENIDHKYLGAIEAGEALRLSRNIPAVKMLEHVGITSLAEKMSKMNLRTAGSLNKYGLSLALGTSEMSLLELTNAYATLGRLGKYKPLRVLSDGPKSDGVKVFSQGAAWLTLKSLNHLSGNPRVVWKTGTSWNNRDAWAICITKQYVIGVWCGNMSGQGNSKLVGAEAALPVALEIATKLTKCNEKWEVPSEIAVRKVCALSGHPASRFCARSVNDEYLLGVSSQRVCVFHVDEDEIRWPVEVAALMKTKKQNLEMSESKALPLTIISPLQDAQYFITKSSADYEDTISLKSESKSQVYYYLDGDFIGQAKAGATLKWRMTPGFHSLTAVDSKSTAKISFNVNMTSMR